jgi:hypothetical protein
MTGFYLQHTFCTSHHIRKRVSRATNAADVLDYCIAFTFDTRHRHGRKGRETNRNFTAANTGRFPEESSVTFNMDQHTSGECMVIPAECCTGPADAVMIYLDIVSIDCREDPFAGA